MKLCVSVGVQLRAYGVGDERKCDLAGVLVLDFHRQEILRVAHYAPDSSIVSPNGTVRMAYGSILSNAYYTCVPTEVVRVSLPDLEIRSLFSNPRFNDLHHVLALEDRLLVVNTGLESLETYDYEGTLLQEFNAATVPTWERFSPTVDYRLEDTTKPHERHINYAFLYEDKTWVTRFKQKDAVCVSDPQDVMPVGVGNPHDGIVLGDEVWFTTTNGHIVVVDGPNRRLKRDIDLNQIEHPLADAQLGWCRGLRIDGRFAYVGFSRLRPTKFREFASWVRGTKNCYPTRIEKIDLESESLVETFVLEPHASLVFDVLELPSD